MASCRGPSIFANTVGCKASWKCLFARRICASDISGKPSSLTCFILQQLFCPRLSEGVPHFFMEASRWHGYRHGVWLEAADVMIFAILIEILAASSLLRKAG